jgi:hypothetical protein
VEFWKFAVPVLCVRVESCDLGRSVLVEVRREVRRGGSAVILPGKINQNETRQLEEKS